MIGTPPKDAILQRARRGVRGLPLQFWLLAAGSFVFLAAMGLAFPYTSMSIRDRLGVSMGIVGLLGAVAFSLPGCAVACDFDSMRACRPV